LRAGISFFGGSDGMCTGLVSLGSDRTRTVWVQGEFIDQGNYHK
jgi:hypothetical protein